MNWSVRLGDVPAEEYIDRSDGLDEKHENTQ